MPVVIAGAFIANMKNSTAFGAYAICRYVNKYSMIQCSCILRQKNKIVAIESTS